MSNRFATLTSNGLLSLTLLMGGRPQVYFQYIYYDERELKVILVNTVYILHDINDKILKSKSKLNKTSSYKNKRNILSSHNNNALCHPVPNLRAESHLEIGLETEIYLEMR